MTAKNTSIPVLHTDEKISIIVPETLNVQTLRSYIKQGKAKVKRHEAGLKLMFFNAKMNEWVVWGRVFETIK